MKAKMVKKLIIVLLMIMATCLFVACKKGIVEESSALKEESVPHTVHECVKIRAKSSTCLSEGNLEYWSCYGCDMIFSDKNATQEISLSQVTLAKLPHEPEMVDSKESTCDAYGNVAYWRCNNCFTFFEDEDCLLAFGQRADVLTAKKPHDLLHEEALEPEGYQNGNVEYWQCEKCENYFADEQGTMEIGLEDTIRKSPYNIVDFVVEVATGKEPIVLQLTDTQIIDAGQTRPGRGGVDYDFWATDKVNERCYNYIKEVVNATKPDLIILTGDIIYGEFDDNGTALQGFIAFMESLQIPWAPIFGNHENESKMGADWQCEQLEKANYCLFKQRTLTGNGNYSVAIAQGGEIKRVFYMLDSNGCGAASDESMANGHTVKTVGFGYDQIEWYTNQITELKTAVPNVKISFAYHIQTAIFEDAFKEYGFSQDGDSFDINLDRLQETKEGDFGYIGAKLKNPWDEEYFIYYGMKDLGVDSIFVGHEHCNSASVVYDGVRFQFGQKSSEYDRFNYLHSDGSISSKGPGQSLMGGTVIPLAMDGSLKTPYIYYCGHEDGKIDWTQWQE